MNMLFALFLLASVDDWPAGTMNGCNNFWTAKAIAETFAHDGDQRAREQLDDNFGGAVPPCFRYWVRFNPVEEKLKLETEDGYVFVTEVTVYGMRFPQFLITTLSIMELREK